MAGKRGGKHFGSAKSLWVTKTEGKKTEPEKSRKKGRMRRKEDEEIHVKGKEAERN